jgi:hypothetical protein
MPGSSIVDAFGKMAVKGGKKIFGRIPPAPAGQSLLPFVAGGKLEDFNRSGKLKSLERQVSEAGWKLPLPRGRGLR